MQPSVFTRILHGELPGEIIYRSDSVAALLTIRPFTPGHLLVIPTAQVDHLWDLDSDSYAQVMDTARHMAEVLRRAYPEYSRIGMIVEGFEVPHAHVHVLGLDSGISTMIRRHDSEPPLAAGAELTLVAAKLRAAL
ncbi:MAG: HIT family protein [Propionibacteriaceae bacterium]